MTTDAACLQLHGCSQTGSNFILPCSESQSIPLRRAGNGTRCSMIKHVHSAAPSRQLNVTEQQNSLCSTHSRRQCRLRRRSLFGTEADALQELEQRRIHLYSGDMRRLELLPALLRLHAMGHQRKHFTHMHAVSAVNVTATQEWQLADATKADHVPGTPGFAQTTSNQTHTKLKICQSKWSVAPNQSGVLAHRRRRFIMWAVAGVQQLDLHVGARRLQRRRTTCGVQPPRSVCPSRTKHWTGVADRWRHRRLLQRCLWRHVAARGAGAPFTGVQALDALWRIGCTTA